jgi:putative intracellular protease/amidase
MKRKIIAVVTSAGPVLKHGKKTGLWLSELTHFLDVVHDAGFAYDIASPAGGKPPLDEDSVSSKQLADSANAHFLADARSVAALENTLPCRDVQPDEYDAIYLAGGHGTMFDFRQSQDLKRLLTAVASRGRYVTAVCHGVSGLVDTVDQDGKLLVQSKRVTGFSNLEDRLMAVKDRLPYLLEDALKANGGHYRRNLLPFTARVEVDGKLLTGQNPQSAKALAAALVRELR